MMGRISYRLMLPAPTSSGLGGDAMNSERREATAARPRMPELPERAGDRRRGGRRAGDRTPLGRPIHPYSGAVAMQDARAHALPATSEYSTHASALGAKRYRANHVAQKRQAMAALWPDRLVSIEI